MHGDINCRNDRLLVPLKCHDPPVRFVSRRKNPTSVMVFGCVASDGISMDPFFLLVVPNRHICHLPTHCLAQGQGMCRGAILLEDRMLWAYCPSRARRPYWRRTWDLATSSRRIGGLPAGAGGIKGMVKQNSFSLAILLSFQPRLFTNTQ